MTIKNSALCKIAKNVFEKYSLPVYTLCVKHLFEINISKLGFIPKVYNIKT
jgi:hypothetical protein